MVRVYGAARTDDAVPPARRFRLAGMHPRDMRISRERVTYENDVVVRGRLASARFPCDIHARQNATILKAEPAIRYIERRQMSLYDANRICFVFFHVPIL